MRNRSRLCSSQDCKAKATRRSYRRAKARDHTERLLRHLGVAVDETETTVRMTPPDRLPAFNVTLPGDISTAALPIACVVASPLPGGS